MDDDRLSTPQKLQLASLFAAGSVVALYLLTPARDVDGLLPENTGWLLWTPAIPLLLGLAFMLLTFVNLGWHISYRVAIAGSACLMLLATLGHQFGTMSPIGSDGWFFTELARLHLEFGSSGIIDAYLIHPGVLLLVEWVWWLSPEHAPAAAAVTGLLLAGCLYWLMCTALVRERAGDTRWLPVVSAGFAGLMLSGWNPASFSAQLLALVLWFWLVHHRLRSGAERDPWLWAGVLLLTITHMFTPLILLLVLLFEGRFPDAQGKTARWLAVIVYAAWISWAIGPAFSSTLVHIEHLELPFSRAAIPLLGLLPLLVMLVFALRHPGGDEPERVGARMSSVVFGVLAFVPVLLLQEMLLGAGSFAQRSVLFLFVPLGYFLYDLPVHTEFDSTVRALERRKQLAALGVVSLLVGAAMGVAHALWVQRSLVMPAETADCWDEAAQVGVWGLVDGGGGDRWTVLHSPQLRPPTVDEGSRGWFDSLGESNDATEARTGAIIQTVDISLRAQREEFGMDWQTWPEMGGVDGACKILVRPEATSQLTPGVWG